MMRITQKEIENAVYDGNVNLLLKYFPRVSISEYEFNNFDIVNGYRQCEITTNNTRSLDRDLIKNATYAHAQPHSGGCTFIIRFENIEIFINIGHISAPWVEEL